ncbi:MAG: hypothetical protein ACP5UV_01285 [Thermoplasmata archaeon]
MEDSYTTVLTGPFSIYTYLNLDDFLEDSFDLPLYMSAQLSFILSKRRVESISKVRCKT